MALHFIMNSNVNEILLDNGETEAVVEALLRNQNLDPVQKCYNIFISDKGIIEPVGTTNNDGIISLAFSDNGTQDDIGLANIVGSFNHPGFSSTIVDSVQISITTNNGLSHEVIPISYDENGATIIVGEDVSKQTASSLLIATVLDSLNAPVSGIPVQFEALSNGQEVGSVTYFNEYSNLMDKAIGLFDDNDNVYKDNPGTPNYEGVSILAKIGDETTEPVNFNVYPADDVWPYSIVMNSDVNEILLDNGETIASIQTQVRNQNLDPVKNITLSFASDRGIIESVGTTNDAGIITLDFTDNGIQSDIGLASIVGSFSHPGFSSTIEASVQISITTNIDLSHEVIPVSYDNNGATIIVGEDVSGPTASSLLVATVLDSLNTPVSGVPIEFEVTSNGLEVGSITYLNEFSNSDGQVIGVFDDNDNVYNDNPGTPNYEGVSVIAKFGDKTTEPINFNVFSIDEIWPYNLVLDSDTDVISLDGGATSAQISIRLLNRLGNPVEGAQISYVSTLGFIAATGFTDSLGADTVAFTDLGNPNDIGVSDIYSSFSHPGFEGVLIQDSLQVYIEDPSFQSCAYMEIPASIPGNIVVRDGGGLESTFIRAEVYDDNGNLMDTPTPVVFTMEPMVGDAYLEDTPGQTSATLFTVNGVATVSINSGTEPGPVRIVATCDCDQDGAVDLTVVDVPVIISSGAPYSIEAEYDPNSTTAIGGGFTRLK